MASNQEKYFKFLSYCDFLFDKPYGISALKNAYPGHEGEFTRLQKYQFLVHGLIARLPSTIAIVDSKRERNLEWINCLYEYIWESEGRLIWQVSREAVEFVLGCRCDLQASQFMMPRDAVVMVFPEDFHLPGADLPLRSGTIGRLGGSMAYDLAHKLMGRPVETNGKTPGTFFAFDFGESMPNKDSGRLNTPEEYRAHIEAHGADYNWHAKGTTLRSFLNIPDDCAISEFPMPVETFAGLKVEAEAVREGAILASKILFLAKAKPDLLVSHKVKPRPHRRYPRIVQRVTIPTIYLGARATAPGAAPGDGGGWKVRPHMRGWSMRELRHPRYKRNPDGSPKVILVEAYPVGVTDVEDLPEDRRRVKPAPGGQP